LVGLQLQKAPNMAVIQIYKAAKVML
jgi:hypothetical protein